MKQTTCLKLHSSFLLSLRFHPQDIFPWKEEWRSAHTRKIDKIWSWHLNFRRGPCHIIPMEDACLKIICQRRPGKYHMGFSIELHWRYLKAWILFLIAHCSIVRALALHLLKLGAFLIEYFLLQDVALYAMYKSNMECGSTRFAKSLTCKCGTCVNVGCGAF